MNSFSEYASKLGRVMSSVSQEHLDQFVALLEQARKNDGTIWLAGNGGSAATADHMAVDLMLGLNVEPAFRCISLASNSAALTATGNDYSFEQVFSRSLSRLARKNDVLVLISASGNSENLIQAASVAKSIGIVVVGITAFDGGRLRKVSDIEIHCETEVGEYGISEDCHLAINHYLKTRLSK